MKTYVQPPVANNCALTWSRLCEEHVYLRAVGKRRPSEFRRGHVLHTCIGTCLNREVTSMKVVGHNVNTQCRNWKEQGCTVASNPIGVPECMRRIFHIHDLVHIFVLNCNCN